MAETPIDSLYQRIRAGIDWGRSGPWPPDAVTALDELIEIFQTEGKKDEPPQAYKV